MANASFVVASSFHGTAFAINFNRQFITITPGAFSSRIASLLEITGLTERRISEVSELSDHLLQSPIDYEPVNAILDNQRQQSLSFLRNSIL